MPRTSLPSRVVVWRRLVIILAILCGTVVGVAVGLTSERVAKNLAERVELLARERLGVELDIGRLEIELFPPALTVHGVQLKRRADAPTLASLHRGKAVLQPWPSTAGALIVQDLELDGLYLDSTLLTEPAAAPAPAPAPRPPPASPPAPAPARDGALPLDIHRLQLWNTELVAELAGRRVHLRGTDFIMTPDRDSGRNMELRVKHGYMTVGERGVGFELALRAGFSGTLDRPEGLELHRATLSLPRVAVHAAGGVRLTGTPRLALELESEAQLTSLMRLLDGAPPMAGDAHLSARIEGPPSRLGAHVRADVRGLVIAGHALGDVEAEADYVDRRISLESFAVQHPRAGKMTGSGTIDVAEGFPVALSTRLHHASLPEILDLSGLPGAWVRLDFNGDVRVDGKLSPLYLTLGVAGHAERFAVLDRSYRAADATVVLAVPHLALNGNVRVGRRDVTLDGVQVTLGDSVVTAEGNLAYDPAQGMNLRATSAGIDLRRLGTIGGVTFGGDGPAAVAVEGPYADPVVSATAEIDALEVLGFHLGDAKGTLIYSDKALQLDRMTVRRRDGVMSGAGRIDFGPVITVEASASLERVDLSAALVDLRVPEPLARRLKGKVSGELTLDGPIVMPGGTMALRTGTLRVDDVDMGPATLNGGFADDDERVWGDLRLEPQGGDLDLRVGWTHEQTLTVAGHVARVPLDLLSPFMGAVPMAGALSGQVRLAGPPDKLSGTANARLRDWSVYDVRLETSRLQATFDAGRVEIEGTLLDGAAKGTATLVLGEALAYVTTIGFADLELSRLITLPAGVGLVGSGTLFSQGDLLRPQGLLADINLSAAKLRWNEVELRAVRPLVLNYAGETLHFGDATFGGAGLVLSLAGAAPLRGELDLTLNGRGSLEALSRLSPRVDVASGRFDTSLRVRGTWSAPYVEGGASLAAGALRLRNAGQSLQNLDARLAFAGRTVQIESATARLGGGAVRASGQMLFAPDALSEVNVRAELDDVSIKPSADLNGTFSGALNLQGPMDDLLLSGRVKLQSLRYTRNLDLTAMIPEQGRPLHVPAIEPSEVMRLAVKVEAPNNIIVANNVLDAEFRADLSLTGTTSRMGLLGSISPLWAKARYRDNVFKVERASIDFTEEFRIFTQFDIRAATEACGMDIAVSIFGDSDRYNVVPEGSDDKGAADPQDVLVCLQFGLRLRDFEGHDAAGLGGLGQTLPGGLDALWTVSGMDEKVRRVLPIELDEVRLTSSWSSQHKRATPRLLVGKEIGRNLELKLSRSLEDDTDYHFSLEYRLSNVATLQGTWLSVSDVPVADFGVDLRLRWEFR